MSQVRSYDDVIVVFCASYQHIVEILTNKIDCYAHIVSISRTEQYTSLGVLNLGQFDRSV